MGFSPFDGVMFTIIPVIIGMGFILVFGVIVFMAIKGFMEWDRNNRSPVLAVEAKIVTKRMAVNGRHHHHHGGNMTMHHTIHTSYFATFEMENGDRMELKIPNREYGMLAEGDVGKLTFQGTRYKEFECNRK